MTLVSDLTEDLSSSNWHLKMAVFERDKRDYPKKKTLLALRRETMFNKLIAHMAFKDARTEASSSTPAIAPLPRSPYIRSASHSGR